MKVSLRQRRPDGKWVSLNTAKVDRPQLVLAFGAPAVLRQFDIYPELKSQYPDAHIVLCSSAGEIAGDEVYDDTVSFAAIQFERDSSRVQIVQTDIQNAKQSHDAGLKLAKELAREGLIHAFVLSDGTLVNGSALVEGLIGGLPANVPITGGLVGDGTDFKKTVIGVDAPPESGKIVLIGLYGDRLKIGYGSLGGWDIFGPERTITKAEGNILYEIGRKPALSLYKEYLGNRAQELPSSGLLFPLRVTIKRKDGSEAEVVRTLLAVNEEDQSMTFAGDMPVGSPMRMMKANIEHIIDGAANAAKASISAHGDKKPDLAILISCIGRKLVLKERAFEEIEAVKEYVGPDASIIGFHSYGEVCPVLCTETEARLHNQTMTITTIREE